MIELSLLSRNSKILSIKAIINESFIFRLKIDEQYFTASKIPKDKKWLNSNLFSLDIFEKKSSTLAFVRFIKKHWFRLS